MHADELTKQLRAPDQRGCGRVHQVEAGVDNIDRLAALDAVATAIREWSGTIIPGNLQTIAYSEAVIRGSNVKLPAHEMRRRVLLKSGRSQAFGHNADLEYACFILGERSIVNAITSDALHIAQLRYLLLLSQQHRMVIRVMPDGPVPGMADSFSLYRLDVENRVGYVETAMGAWYSTRGDDTLHLSRIFDEIRRVALSPPSTERFIKGVMESWPSRKTPSPDRSPESRSSSRPILRTTASEWQLHPDE